jgi:SAM-dependent methyltransferase
MQATVARSSRPACRQVQIEALTRPKKDSIMTLLKETEHEEVSMKHAGGYEEYAFVAEFYDHVVPYRDRQDVAFFVQAATGSGGPVFQLVEADMRDFELSQTFNLVTVPFRPFQHLITVDDQLACLKQIGRHLADGGQLILDLFNPSLPALVSDNLGQELGDEPEFTTPDGLRVVRRHRTVSRDLFNQVNYVELIYHVTHPDGREERLVHSFPMRYLFRFEVEHLLVRCGFQIEHVYADFDKSPYGSKYPGELITVAKKVVR